jgi:periplasmic divalent cation tolerance protein
LYGRGKISTISESLQARLDALRATYLESLPGRLELIERLWDRLNSHRTPEELKEMHLAVHSLAGSGATFGLRKPGDTAKRLELLIKRASNIEFVPED